MNAAVAKKAFDFDPENLRRRYVEERDKRLRPEGNEQYIGVEGRFAHFMDDPYVDPGFTRAPLADEVDVIIVGGGFAGLFAGARLREAGVKSIRIIEKAGDFGGTWYWNRYPGCACDVESYIYLPLLEETGYMPKRKYAPAPEIMEHCRRIGRHFGLYDHACFQTQVTSMTWDATAARWRVKTDRGDDMRARFVIVGPGPLNRPKLPGIPGIDTFKGHAFHTSRWDYAYTGGGPEGNLAKLADKRVGIIGTGATAIQCIPHLGASAKQLYVFQRTPSVVDVRNDRETDPAWAKALTPGWQRRRQVNFDSLIAGIPVEDDQVGDGWTEIFRTVFSLAKAPGGTGTADLEELRQLADFQKLEQIRARVDAVVKDPATAEALKPWYNMFCKRPCFHDDYLETFNRPNVTLVDTAGRGVERLTEHGVVANGKEYEVDCLVFATGFEVGTDYTRRADFEVRGRDSLSLTDRWKGGVKSLHGMQTRGFPNFFIIGGAQSGVTVNIPLTADEQAKHIAHVISTGMSRQVRSIEISEAAENAWQAEMAAKAVNRDKFFTECTPGYYNGEGKPEDGAFFSGIYGGGPFEYMRLLEDWRANGGLGRDEVLTAE
ncbi:MAG: NAD(P)/FAD-dependent oxidoreductase [Alphaproteobacteria bacterium]|nr:NAD(P)/FAD-dependent oxidoreductase [Alphaproteobacteria bacterium]